jgi:hypothetical protein
MRFVQALTLNAVQFYEQMLPNIFKNLFNTCFFSDDFRFLETFIYNINKLWPV